MDLYSAQPTPPLPPAAQARLDAFNRSLPALRDSFVGYPCNTAFDARPLAEALAYPLNNVGDPFGESYYQLNTFPFEREVVDWYAERCRAPKGGVWGYVTNGGTEGNLYGLYLARELHPNGVVYYSEHTHYSAAKIVHLLGVRAIMIRGQDNGEMDYADLRETLRLHRDVPPIILANIGTTMHGAVDDLDTIQGILKELAIGRRYIHCDAALSGMILPFVRDPQPFDFGAGADSISVSGHKFFGSPIPCGIVLARRSHVDRVARNVEYVGCMDTTISGSRNGLTPLLLWTAIQRHGEAGFRAMAERGEALAEHAIARFRAIGVHAWRHPHSLTVVFPRPPEDLLRRWQVAPQGEIAHLLTMPGMNAGTLDAFIADYAASRGAAASRA